MPFYPALHFHYHYCEAEDISGQLNALTSEADADAWLIRGVRSKRLQEKLNGLGLPVFFLDAEVPGVPAVCKIGEDCYKSGRIAASLMAKAVNYSEKIVVIADSSEIISHKQRLEGFYDYLSVRFPRIQIVEQLFSGDLGVVAHAQACNILNLYPDLKGICNLAGYAGEIG